MKVISLSIVHYGREYLQWALRSLHDVVDLQYVLYTPRGSHGYQADIPCPDTREQLIQQAIEGAGNKLRWHEGTYANESQHRGMIEQLEPDADVILVCDADEIWPSEMAQKAIENAPYFEQVNVMRLRTPMVHFWRSFHRAIINDHSYPERVIYPKHKGGSKADLITNEHIAHMGYAQRSEIVKYKILTHGHKADWRGDWYDTKWLPNAQIDIHPTNVDFWLPETVNPYDYMPSWMHEHPYANLEVIP